MRFESFADGARDERRVPVAELLNRGWPFRTKFALLVELSAK